jgi:hypothetical protein
MIKALLRQLYRVGGYVVSSAFTRHLIMFSIVLCAIIVSILLIDMGVFGAELQSRLRTAMELVQDANKANKEAVEFALKLAGLVVSAVVGALGILRTFYYAEIMLPKRLQELADKVKHQHLVQRRELLAYVNGPFSTKDFLVPTIFANPFAKLGSLCGYLSIRNQARQFANSVERLDGEIKTLATTMEDFKERKVTAHLVRAAFHQAVALTFEITTLDWRRSMELAREEFIAALTLRPDDLNALDGAACQSRVLTDENNELIYLNRIVVAAKINEFPLQHARAQRQIAEIFANKGQPRLLDEARSRLDTAIGALTGRASASTQEASEMATAERVYGEVQTKREKFTAARNALMRANYFYGTVDGPYGIEGRRLVGEAIKRLDAVAGDKEAAVD